MLCLPAVGGREMMGEAELFLDLGVEEASFSVFEERFVRYVHQRAC